jgi:type IV pilus biogenesis protein PilP
MKPSFALNLSHEGIRLFSRAKGGWRLVGETELDTPELGETLAYLRDKATRLSGSGLSCKLVLPNSQILFTSITAPGPDDQTREAQIREALTGMTPYTPDELAFTWRVAGDLVNVAAVARETLQEAEAFAVEHRFNPVSFVGDAGDANFDGEPFFGATDFSQTLLDAGDSVEPDAEAFVILEQKQSTGRKIFSGSLRESVLLTPVAEAKSMPETEVEEQKVEEVEDTSPSDATDVAISEPETAPVEAEPEESTAEDVTEAETQDVPAADISGDVSEDTAEGTPLAATPEPPQDALPETADNTEIAGTNDAEASTPAPENDDAEPQALSETSIEDASEEAETSDLESEAQNSDAQTTSLAPELSDFFSNIRAATPLENTKPVELPEHLAKAKGTTSVPETISPSRKSFGASRDDASDGPEFVHRPLAAGKPPEALAARLNASNSAPTPPKAAQKDAKPKPDVAHARKRIKTGIVSGVAASLKRKPKVQENATVAKSVAETAPAVVDAPEATGSVASTSIPNAFKRFTTSRTKGGEDKQIDTVVAIPVVSESAAKQIEAPEADAGANVTAATLDLPNSEDLAASLNEASTKSGRAATQTTASGTGAVTVFGAQKSLVDRGKPRHLGLMMSAGLVLLMGGAAFWSLRGNDDTADSAEVSASEAFTAFNETLSSPVNETQSIAEQTEVARLTTDTNVPVENTAPEALAITETEVGSVTEEAAANEPEVSVVEQPVETVEPDVPVPFTSEEALAAYADTGIWQKSPVPLPSPDLSTTESLYHPSLDPIVDLSDAVALPNAAEPDDIPLPAQPSPAPAGSTFVLAEDGLVIPSREGTMNPDGILVFQGPPAKRSAPRPDTGGVGRSTDTSAPELSRRRPTGRPTDLSEQQEKASLGGRTRTELARIRPTARPLSDQIIAQTDADGSAISTSATDAAVTRALIPVSRPAGFAALVETARANPANIQTPTAAVAQRPAATGPTIPTRASVATEATQKKAINTRKVTLIGVYGTASARTALIRMKNGRTVEVKIGDRVDGGKVAAIGADQVRYVKGGRNILLKMPARG